MTINIETHYRGRRGRHHMVLGFTSTYAISVYEYYLVKWTPMALLG
jgi:hypothetical protein